MNRLLNLLAMSVGSWLGWIVGAWVSVFMAFIVSVVGMGLGLYAARQITHRLLP